MPPPPPPRRSLARRLLPLLVAGVVLTALTTYAPLLASWLYPQLLSPESYGAFSHQKQDFDVVVNGPRLRWLGHERSETTVARGTLALNRPTASRWEAALAEQALRTDLALLGPHQGDPFARPGFILHRCRLGLPFPCVEATMASIWHERSAERQGLTGGLRFDPLPNRPATRGVWLLPYGVLPLGLFANLAFWTLLVSSPRLARWTIRERRRRAGRCTACGYDRRGLASGPCPECGTAAAA